MAWGRNLLRRNLLQRIFIVRCSPHRTCDSRGALARRSTEFFGHQVLLVAGSGAEARQQRGHRGICYRGIRGACTGTDTDTDTGKVSGRGARGSPVGLQFRHHAAAEPRMPGLEVVHEQTPGLKVLHTRKILRVKRHHTLRIVGFQFAAF